VMASVGNGTTPQLAGEMFKLIAGINLLHVPYQGASPALTDLLGGRANVMFEAMPTLVGYIKSGKLQALAVGTKTRSPVFPEIPTVAEFLPGYEATVYFCLHCVTTASLRRASRTTIMHLGNQQPERQSTNDSKSRPIEEHGHMPNVVPKLACDETRHKLRHSHCRVVPANTAGAQRVRYKTGCQRLSRGTEYSLKQSIEHEKPGNQHDVLRQCEAQIADQKNNK
jgi:hypothetical protein